ncbi:hypothetical protein [Flavobacterium sp. 7A]|uniref:hypothetical protein n=1 Tax=Flavobacterium sp. 7A TaxID=2940571 RepID=UPI00222693D2|nr:hypothetical protein [Flavobacterium sp. 7A]MCW2119865.1 hypothetical protein [Flavobacterium sp. 7A]
MIANYVVNSRLSFARNFVVTEKPRFRSSQPRKAWERWQTVWENAGEFNNLINNKMELKDLIIKYYNSDDKTEKAELRSELLKKKTELDLPEAFQIAVFSHYTAYEISKTKGFLDAMLKFSSQ